MGAGGVGVATGCVARCAGPHDGRVGKQRAVAGPPCRLRQVIFSMTPKPRAEIEARPRPTGRLTYAYRVWMAIRKGQQKGWSLDTHEGEQAGVTTVAARTRANIDVNI